MRIEDFDEIYLDIWQIMANYGEIWCNLAGKVPRPNRVGGTWGDRSENPNSADSDPCLTRCLTLKGGRRISMATASRRRPHMGGSLGLAWAGLGWPGLAWAGLGWPGLAWAVLGWPGLDVEFL